MQHRRAERKTYILRDASINYDITRRRIMDYGSDKVVQRRENAGNAPGTASLPHLDSYENSELAPHSHTATRLRADGKLWITVLKKQCNVLEARKTHHEQSASMEGGGAIMRTPAEQLILSQSNLVGSMIKSRERIVDYDSEQIAQCSNGMGNPPT